MNRDNKGLVGIHNLSALHNWCQIVYIYDKHNIYIAHTHTSKQTFEVSGRERLRYFYSNRLKRLKDRRVKSLNIKSEETLRCYRLRLMLLQTFFCESLDMQKKRKQEEEEEEKKKAVRRGVESEMTAPGTPTDWRIFHLECLSAACSSLFLLPTSDVHHPSALASSDCISPRFSPFQCSHMLVNSPSRR